MMETYRCQIVTFVRKSIYKIHGPPTQNQNLSEISKPWYVIIIDTVSGQNGEENMTGNICDGVDVMEEADLSMEDEGEERRLTQSFAHTPRNERGLPEASVTGMIYILSIWRGVKMHSLIPKCIEMCSLIENALLNLLNVPLNYLSKISDTTKYVQ